MIRFLSAINNIILKLLATYYNIGFIELEDINNINININKKNVHIMRHNLKCQGWFADPFIYDYDENEIILLAEEKVYSLGRGIIVKLVIDRNTYSLKECIPILTLDSHLSFPVIFRKDGKEYIYPENCASGSLKLYEYDNKSNTTHYVQTIINRALTDSIIFERNDSYWLIATEDPDNLGKKLLIFRSNTPFGGYKEYKVVDFHDYTGRNGGNVLKCNGTYYKVSQDCNGGYGLGLVFHEIDEYFNFKEKKRIHINNHTGLHTYNRCRNLVVIDYRTDVYPFFTAILRPFRIIRRVIKYKM